MSRPLLLMDHRKEFQFVVRAIGECMDDLRTSERGSPVSYNMDFGLLCPVLFSKPGKGSKDFLAGPVNTTRRVLERGSKDGNFQIVISGPTVIEFFDQLDHALQGARRAAIRIPTRYADFDERRLRDQLLTSQELRDDLGHLTRSGLDARLRQPIERMLQLLDSGSVLGIGDVVDIEAVRRATDRSLFESFVRQHRAGRARLDANRRSLADSAFHYKLDAANSCLTLAAARAEGAPTYFLTTTAVNVRQCTVGNVTYARLDRTPLFTINIESMLESGMIDNSARFLKLAAREGLELIKELEGYPSLDDCPPHLQIRMANFYSTYVGPLAATEPGSHVQQEHHVDEIAETIRDRRRIRELLDEAAEDAKAGARRLEQHAAALDLSYIDEFDFRDDPVLNRMRTNLGVLRG